ncbi:hypothetical protein GOBAR_DD28113 [Gossypium barbadense]|nr:hypothetical protein GOBAR_DD28113 [Gossypium barbadense]
MGKLPLENRIAAILLKEAAERRRQAERDSIHVFLQHPKVRGRSNARFPAATVLGVQVKCSRGSIGSRMDETGPYLPTNSESLGKQSTS